MIPYCVSSGDIPKQLVELFHTMRTAFENLPDFEGELITCHAVCTAFAEHYNLTCIDGYFDIGGQHSWLIDPEYPNVILDIYPVAGASSFIIYKHWATIWAKLYTPIVFDIDTEIRERQVKKILSAL